LESTVINTTKSLADVQTLVDAAITGQAILPLHFHQLNAGADWSTATFQALIDYVVTKAKAGLIYPITIDDYYRLTLGPVRVPKVR
jgi:hypothetical protein